MQFQRSITTLAALGCASAVAAQKLPEEQPLELQGVGIEEHLDAPVPLDLTFTDAAGQEIQLGDCFDGETPVILTLNYYGCPMLCSLTLNGLTDGMSEMSWDCGDEFRVVTVSIDPTETAALAKQNKQGYLEKYGRESAKEGWRFLTGSQENITALADAVGFGYVQDENTGEYLHTASIMFITPDGRISKYMNDVRFLPRDLRFALVEASEGKIGSPLDKLLLFNCFRYDPESNSYTPSAWKLMRSAGVLTLVVLVGGLAVLGWASPKRIRAGQERFVDNDKDASDSTP
jgi:protein SCO1/2